VKLPGRPILRKTIKWGGAVAVILLVVVWVVSGRHDWTIYPGTEFVANLYGGRVSLSRMDSAAHRDFVRATIESLQGFGFAPEWHWNWWCSLEANRPFLKWEVAVPLWFLGLPLLACTLAAWRLDARARRRARTSHCQKCNYDRAGLSPDARCPECGAPTAPAQAVNKR
jgi:hypothetical protein